jgi:hypothetical protein
LIYIDLKVPRNITHSAAYTLGHDSKQPQGDVQLACHDVCTKMAILDVQESRKNEMIWKILICIGS